jgi:hypothetical protein
MTKKKQLTMVKGKNETAVEKIDIPETIKEEKANIATTIEVNIASVRTIKGYDNAWRAIGEYSPEAGEELRRNMAVDLAQAIPEKLAEVMDIIVDLDEDWFYDPDSPDPFMDIISKDFLADTENEPSAYDIAEAAMLYQTVAPYAEKCFDLRRAVINEKRKQDSIENAAGSAE